MLIGYLAIVLFISLVVSIVAYPPVIRRLRRVNITGKDINKPEQPEIAEMGGLVIVGGFTMGILMAIGIDRFIADSKPIDTPMLLATLCSVLIIAIIGIFDDLIHIRKPLKMILPIFAALPLVVVKAGTTYITVPFIGYRIDFYEFYPLVLVPIGMTGAANATNILAGFNGLEAGMGIIAASALAIINYVNGQYTPCIILVCLLGTLIATMVFNRHPAKVFLGDVGTLVIGAVLCSACVLGNCETAGIIVLIPHAIDFFFKLRNGLPSTNWGGIWNDGKLHCPQKGPVGLCQFLMKITGGIKEVLLVRTLLVIEVICSAVAVALYWR